MRYGTVLVVRAVGGMAGPRCSTATIRRPPAERNGYVFHQADNLAIEFVLSRTLGQWSG
jgi:starch synthase